MFVTEKQQAVLQKDHVMIKMFVRYRGDNKKEDNEQKGIKRTRDEELIQVEEEMQWKCRTRVKTRND